MTLNNRRIDLFMNTIETEDTKKAEQLLCQGLDINFKDISGISALHRAVALGKIEFVQFLLSKGASVEIKNDNHSTPIHYAIIMKYTKIAILLLEYCSNLNMKDNKGMTLLHLACEEKMYDFISVLLKKGADPQEIDTSGRTPLGHLIQHIVTKADANKLLESYDLIVKSLLPPFCHRKSQQSDSYRYSENSLTDCDGMTLLHFACKYKISVLAEILLEKGEKINRKDSLGRTPLHLLAATSSEKFSINLLLDKGAKVGERDLEGLTPLHYACTFKNTDSILGLLQQGANVDVTDNFGRTPIHVVALIPLSICHPKLCEVGITNKVTTIMILLLKNCENVNAKDLDGLTALHYACQNKDLDMCLALLDKKANVNEVDQKGRTPLHHLAFSADKRYSNMNERLFVNMYLKVEMHSFGHESKTLNPFIRKVKEVASQILKAGADPNKLDKSGQSPLHVLAASRASSHLSIFGPMFQYGVDVNARDANQCTPLHLVLDVDKSLLFKTLLVAGASLNSKNNKGETPIAFLSEERSTKKIPTLLQLTLKRQVMYRVIEHIFKLEKAGLPVPRLSESLKKLLMTEIGYAGGADPSQIFKLSNMSEELKKIRSTKILGEFSLSIVFSSFGDPHYLKNQKLSQEIEKILNSSNLDEQYPEYCYYLRSMYKLSKERLQLLPKVHEVMNKVFNISCNKNLPLVVIRYLARYLENCDLKNVIESSRHEQPKVEQPKATHRPTHPTACKLLCPTCAAKSLKVKLSSSSQRTAAKRKQNHSTKLKAADCSETMQSRYPKRKLTQTPKFKLAEISTPELLTTRKQTAAHASKSSKVATSKSRQPKSVKLKQSLVPKPRSDEVPTSLHLTPTKRIRTRELSEASTSAQ